MNALALKLGLSPDLQFYDVYSLTDPTLLSMIPRPVYALLVILPLTAAWNAHRMEEDKDKEEYASKGVDEPVMWFKQTIGHACGSIGLLHCVLNGPAKEHIDPDSTFDHIKDKAIGLGVEQRARMLYNDHEFEKAHQSVGMMGDTVPPDARGGEHLGQHFVAFVKEGGRLWELEGSRKGPLDRGALGEDDDVLSPRAIELGLGRVIGFETKSGGGDLRFSCIALAKKVAE